MGADGADGSTPKTFFFHMITITYITILETYLRNSMSEIINQ